MFQGLSRVPAVAPAVPDALALQAAPDRALYDILYRYYLSNHLYDDLLTGLAEQGYQHDALKELRNPVSRAVEFHVAKLWPGDLPQALPLVAENARIVAPIQRIWRWSNWAMQKQLAVRYFALFGPLFLKVNEQDGDDGTGVAARRVFLQVLDPRHVTEYNVNERGYLTYIRIDVPQLKTDLNPRSNLPEKKVEYWTEVWTKDRVRIWKQAQGPGWAIPAGGRGNVTDKANDLGFVPVVWAPFRLINQRECVGVVTQALTRIDETNRMATRLHQMLFRYNKPLWALKSNANDPSGRPMPPPQLQFVRPAPTFDSPAIADGTVQIGDDTLLGLPGQSELQPLVPPVDYNAHLQTLKEMQEELRNEIPELRYYDLAAKSNVSGVALSFILGDAVDRVLEARGMAEAALVRAHEIALTIAQRANIDGFRVDQIGTYAAGDFTHSIASRPVFPMSITEQAGAVKAWVDAGVPLKTALRWVGRNPEDITQIDTDTEADHQRGLQLKGAEQQQSIEAQEQQLALQMRMAEEKAVRDHERAKELAQFSARLKTEMDDTATQRQVALADAERQKQLELAASQADDQEQRAARAAQRQYEMGQQAADAQVERDVAKLAKMKEVEQQFAPPPAPPTPRTKG